MTDKVSELDRAEEEYAELNAQMKHDCGVQIDSKAYRACGAINGAGYSSASMVRENILSYKIDQLKVVAPATKIFLDALNDDFSGEFFGATRLPWSVFQREFCIAQAKRVRDRSTLDKALLGLLPTVGARALKKARAKVWPKTPSHKVLSNHFSIKGRGLVYKSNGKACKSTVSVNGASYYSSRVLYKLQHKSLDDRMAVVNEVNKARAVSTWDKLEAIDNYDYYAYSAAKAEVASWFKSYMESGDVNMTVAEQLDAARKFAETALHNQRLYFKMTPFFRAQTILSRRPLTNIFSNEVSTPNRPEKPPVHVPRKRGGLRTPNYRDRKHILAEYEVYEPKLFSEMWLAKKGYGPIEDRVIKSRYVKRNSVRWRTSDVLHVLKLGMIRDDEIVLHMRASEGDFRPNFWNLVRIPKNVGALYPEALAYHGGKSIDYINRLNKGESHD